jgi:hypothetical protein
MCRRDAVPYGYQPLFFVDCIRKFEQGIHNLITEQTMSNPRVRLILYLVAFLIGQVAAGL